MRNDVTAKQVKTLYTRRRRIMHPNYKANERWNTCWEKIADKINKLGCDPVDYIEAQFLYRFPFPHPNTMYSQKSEDMYEVFISEHKSGSFMDDLRESFEYMVDLLESRVKIGLTKEDVLVSDSLQFTPLFRYAMLNYFGRGDLAENYRESAFAEYEAHPDIMRLYGEFMDGGTCE